MWAIATAERVLRDLPPSGWRDEALAAIEIARGGELGPLRESLMLACFPVYELKKTLPATRVCPFAPGADSAPKPHRQHWTDDLADLDRRGSRVRSDASRFRFRLFC